MFNALTTDLYQLSMLAAAFESGLYKEKAVFELSVRKLPPNRRFMVFMGLQKALEYLRGLSFLERDIDFLKKVPQLQGVITEEFEWYLRDFEFCGDVWAMEEGQVFFPNEPVMRIEATFGQAQLVETALLSIVNSASAVATKAARIVQAAQGRDLLEFGTRRTSPEEALESARAAYICGFSGTSNLEAGRLYGIPVAGTMAHSWVMAHQDEPEAFRTWAEVYEGPSMLIDTYDPLEGVLRAIAAAGPRLKSVRFDCGNLFNLTREARGLLDRAGLRDTKILASGDLDETDIMTMVQMGAPIDGYGIGTKLVRSTDAPTLGGVYKLVELSSRPVMKFQKDKETLPGRHQVWRLGNFEGDVIDLTFADQELEPSGAQPLLGKVMYNGQIINNLNEANLPRDIEDIRDRCMRRLLSMPASLVRSWNDSDPAPYSVGTSSGLQDLVRRMKEARR